MAISISEHKSVSVGAGISILTAIAGIYSNYLRARPAWLYAGGISGVALLLAPIIHSLSARDRKLEPASNSGIQTGRDNNGSQVLVKEDYHDYRGTNPALTSPPQATKAEPESANTPKIIIRAHPTVCLSYDSQAITRSETGEPGMIVRVENPEAGVGQQGITAHKVVAIIRFHRPSGEIAGTSEYAFWLDTYENQVTIEPGTSRELVIGTYSNPKVWKYFTNKQDYAPQKPHSWGQMQGYMERMSLPLEPQFILMNPTLEVQLALMSKHNRYTLAKKSFKLYPIENALGQTINFRFEELP
jgi:hypothetical protein